MTTTFSTNTTNPHIAALETVFDEAENPIEWLLITHNEPRMIQSLSSALSGEQATMLELSQDTWDFAGNDLAETIEWALQNSEIKNVVLVGHSQTAGSASRASLVVPQQTKQDDSESGYARLLAGIHRNNVQTRSAQEQFAAHVRQMLQIPVLHNRWSSGELAVYGLFYRAEGGLFLAYDADAGTFRPLVG